MHSGRLNMTKSTIANAYRERLNRAKYTIIKACGRRLNGVKSTLVIVHKWQMLILGIIPKKLRKA